MKPLGIELARRWVAALTLVPIEEREAVVEAVERQITQEFATPDEDEQVGEDQPSIEAGEPED